MFFPQCLCNFFLFFRFFSRLSAHISNGSIIWNETPYIYAAKLILKLLGCIKDWILQDRIWHKIIPMKRKLVVHIQNLQEIVSSPGWCEWYCICIYGKYQPERITYALHSNLLSKKPFPKCIQKEMYPLKYQNKY